MKPAVRTQTATVYRANVGGRGRRFFTAAGAYRAAAIAMVIAKYPCDCEFADYDAGIPAHVCIRHQCQNGAHTYGARLVARLARWLRWRDKRLGDDERAGSSDAREVSP